MAVPAKFRTRASRIRKKRDEGTATAAELRWLDVDYKALRDGPPAAPEPTTSPAPATTSPAAATTARAVPDNVRPIRPEVTDPYNGVNGGSTGLTRFRRSEPVDETERDAEESGEEGAADELEEVDHGPECPIEACPCKRETAQWCPVLQKRIYPPMEERDARGAAGWFLTFISGFVGLGAYWAVRYTTGQRPRLIDVVEPPRGEEIRELGEDLQRLQSTRFNALGAVGPELGALYTGTAYVARAARTGYRNGTTTAPPNHPHPQPAATDDGAQPPPPTAPAPAPAARTEERPTVVDEDGTEQIVVGATA